MSSSLLSLCVEILIRSGCGSLWLLVTRLTKEALPAGGTELWWLEENWARRRRHQVAPLSLLFIFHGQERPFAKAHTHTYWGEAICVSLLWLQRRLERQHAATRSYSHWRETVHLSSLFLPLWHQELPHQSHSYSYWGETILVFPLFVPCVAQVNSEVSHDETYLISYDKWVICIDDWLQQFNSVVLKVMYSKLYNCFTVLRNTGTYQDECNKTKKITWEYWYITIGGVR